MNEPAISQESPRGSDRPLLLAGGKVHVVGGSVPIDERISWYSVQDRGRYLPFNSYLFLDQGDAFLLESGVPAVVDATAAQIRSIAGSEASINRLAVTRNEPDCAANIPLLVRKFGLQNVHSPGLMNPLQYFPADEAASTERSFDHRSTELQMMSFGVGCTPALAGAEIVIFKDRVIDVLAAPLRVLPTVWYYDRMTRTMFCSDSFSDETATTPIVKSVSVPDDSETLIERANRHFLGKFDWLVHSDVSTVIADLEKIFSSHDVENLAPTRGLVIEGRLAVETKVSAMLVALRALQRRHG